jgi:hypothetical protein
MKERVARTIIRVCGIFYWVLGLLMLETAFGFLVVDFAELTRVLFIDEQVAKFIMVVAGLFFIVLGFQVQRFRHWARIAAIAVGAFALVGGVYLMVRCETTCVSWLVSLPLNIFRVLFGVFSIWFFTHEKTVINLFSGHSEINAHKPTGQSRKAVKKK